MTDRGLLMEVRGKTGIVLTPDGRFEEVLLPRPASVGEEIAFPARGLADVGSAVSSGIAPSHARRRRLSLIAVAAALVLGIAASIVVDAVRADRTAVAYVDVDINPSVELGINRFNRVVSFEGIDDEAREMLAGVDLTRMDLEAAVREIASAAETHGYVKPGDEPTVLIAVTPAKGPDVEPEIVRSVEKAKEAVSRHLESKQVKGTVAVIQAAPEIREKARQVNLSSGRLAVLLKAKEEGVDVGPDLLPGDGREATPDREERRGTPGGTQADPEHENRDDRPGSTPESGRRVAPASQAEQAGDRARAAQTEQPAEQRGQDEDDRESPRAQGPRSRSRLADLISGAGQEKDWGRLLDRYGEEVDRQVRDAAGKRGDPGRTGEKEDGRARGDDKQDKEGGEAKPVSRTGARPGAPASADDDGRDRAGAGKDPRENQVRRVPRRQPDRRRTSD